jgi:hypothetical protein
MEFSFLCINLRGKEIIHRPVTRKFAWVTHVLIFFNTLYCYLNYLDDMGNSAIHRVLNCNKIYSNITYKKDVVTKIFLGGKTA